MPHPSPSNHPSNHFRRYREVREIIAGIIHSEGDRLLMELMTARAASRKAVRLPLATTLSNQVKSFTQVVREKGIAPIALEQLHATVAATRTGLELVVKESPGRLKSTVGRLWGASRELTDLQRRAETVLRTVLSSATYLSGMFLGFQLPALDVKFLRKGDSESSITLHEAPLFSLEITLEWVTTLLQKALAHPDISPEDRDYVTKIEMLLQNLKRGVDTGAAARVRAGSRSPAEPPPKGEEVEVPLDARAYAQTRSFFAMLSEIGQRK